MTGGRCRAWAGANVVQAVAIAIAAATMVRRFIRR
jgi:hypothetical protein